MLNFQNDSNVLEFQIETVINKVMHRHNLAYIDKYAHGRLFRMCSCSTVCMQGKYSTEVLEEMIEAELKNIVFDYHMRRGRGQHD